MRLNSIEVKNFRCFEHLQLDLHPRLNVFVGGNASGKTALLEAIRAALGAFFTGFENDDVEQFYLKEEDVRLEFNGRGKIEHRPISIKTGAEIDGQSISWNREFNKRTTSSEEHIGQVKSISKKLSDSNRQKQELDFPCLFYFSTQRLWVERRDFGNAPISGNRFGGYYNSLNAKSASYFFADWFSRMEQGAFQNEQMQLGDDYSGLDVIRTTVAACFPECKRIFYHALEKELFIQFQNGKSLPVSKLSDGQKNLLLLAIGISLQCILLNPHKKLTANETKGVVLIDEVDLHLHPAWQRRVLPDLLAAFPNVQFIVTTHSPQVISTVTRESTFLLIDNKISKSKPFTEGRDSNSLLADVFGIERRPPEIEKKISLFYSLLDKRKPEEANELLSELEHKMGSNDSEIIRANLHFQDLLDEIHQKED